MAFEFSRPAEYGDIADYYEIAKEIGVNHSEIGDREVLTLWITLCLAPENHRSLLLNTKSNIAKDLLLAVRNNRHSNAYVKHHIRLMLNKELFSWITGEENQNKWLWTYADKKYEIAKKIPNFLPRNKKTFISLFDYSNRRGRTADKLDHIKNCWLGFPAYYEKKLKWFQDKKYSAERIEIACDWLKQNAEIYFNGLNAEKHIVNIENYQDLAITLDFINNGNPIEGAVLEILIHKAKTTWTNRNYRRNLKGKSQCNLVLRDKTLKKFDRICEANNLKRPEILECLLELASSHQKQLEYIIKSRRGLNTIDHDDSQDI